MTGMLRRWRETGGGSDARLVGAIERELRRIAASYMRRERPDHTLQPTALVNEAYLRLVNVDVAWEGRAHFFGIAARLMRQICRRRRSVVRSPARGSFSDER